MHDSYLSPPTSWPCPAHAVPHSEKMSSTPQGVLPQTAGQGWTEIRDVKQ